MATPPPSPRPRRRLSVYVGLVVLCLGVNLTPLRAGFADLAQPETPRQVQLPPIPEVFKHPGLLHTKEEIAFMKRKIAAGEEPWKSAFEQMKSTPWAALDYKPHEPRATIRSGFSGAGAREGGVAQASWDAKAAYTQALMWVLTDDERHARNAVDLLNGWSVLRENRGGNWYLQASWLAIMFVNSAELIRHTWPEWKPDDIARFSEMLNEAFLPIFHNRVGYGNRLFSVSYAMMAIGVFNEDRAAFAEGLHRWISYVPAFIYLESDGPDVIRPDYWATAPGNEELAAYNAHLPKAASAWIFRDDEVLAMMKAEKLGDDFSMFKLQGNLDRGGRHWHNAPDAAYVDGLSAETFRDLGHSDLAFASIVSAAEIAWHQGIDLYGLEQKRLIAFMELHSGLRIDETVPPAFYRVRGTPVQSYIEAGYKHYHNRLGIDLPKTRAFIEKALRPCLHKDINGAPGWSWMPVEPGVRAENVVWPIGSNIAWETLTQARTGDEKE